MEQITFRMRLRGMERKKVAEIIAQSLGTVANYEGPPKFCYEASGWRVDKDGMLISPDMDAKRLADAAIIAAALRDAGVSATSTMTVYVFGLSQQVSANIESILRSKANLMKLAFSRDQDEPFARGEHAVRLAFLPATLEPDVLRAYLLFVLKLIDLAARLKRVTAKERVTDNYKYQMRCVLLRMGFIGDEYKTERKILLQNLDGNSAFRHGRP